MLLNKKCDKRIYILVTPLVDCVRTCFIAFCLNREQCHSLVQCSCWMRRGFTAVGFIRILVCNYSGFILVTWYSSLDDNYVHITAQSPSNMHQNRQANAPMLANFDTMLFSIQYVGVRNWRGHFLYSMQNLVLLLAMC